MTCTKTEPPICRCGSYAATIAASFIDYECGSTWDEIEGLVRSQKCKELEKADQ